MASSIFNSDKLRRKLDKINKSDKRTASSLRGLTAALAEAMSERPSESEGPGLDAADIATLRTLIGDQLAKGRYADRTALTDQILFILIGALKAHARDDAVRTWDLTVRSMESLLQAAYRPLVPAYLQHAGAGLLTALCVWSGYHWLQDTPPAQPPLAMVPAPLAEPVYAQIPYVPTHLHSFRRIMMQATCGYPQAAMLPIEQRGAFLDYLRNGQYSLAELRNLEAALSKVECFYASSINNSRGS
jgi:hypothetical protein